MGFETPTSSYREKSWFSTYNRRAAIKLTYHEEIINALYLVKVEAENLESLDIAKKTLIALSPLYAIDQHVSVNSY